MAGLLPNLDAFLYGLLIFAAMFGWGAALARLLFPGRAIDWGIKAGWGLALTIAIGGVLEYLRAISRTAIFIHLGLGLVFLLLAITGGIVKRPRKFPVWGEVRQHRLAAIVCLILIAVILAQYAAWVVNAKYNEFDDLQAYLVYPQKMLQTGSQGEDPFSSRRIETGLGGQSFLIAMALAHVKEPYAHMIDPGLGILLLAALVCGGFRQGVSWSAINISLAFIIFLMPPVANLTMIVIGAALFLALFRTMAEFETAPGAPLRNAFVVALLASAIFGGKTSLVPACGLFLVCSYVARLIQNRNRYQVVAEALLAAAFTLLLLAPWMLSMYRSCHTLFYPFFGKGYHIYAYFDPVTTPQPSLAYLFRGLIVLCISRGVVTFALLVVAAWLGGFLSFRKPNTLLAIVLSTVLATLFIFVALRAYSTGRFILAFMFSANLVLLRELLPNLRTSAQSTPGVNKLLILVCAAAGFWLGGDNAFQIAYDIQSAGTALKLAHAGTPVNADMRSPATEARYAAMQKSIPAGETFLCRVERPYLLDFTRNQIFIDDCPGGQSLPPGMPFFKGPEPQADYLLSKSLRYLAYSYATQALFSHEKHAEKLAEDYHPWFRAAALSTFDFQDNAEELRKSRKNIYDDGDICVIDLAERK